MIETENTASTPFDQNLPHLGNVEDITPHPKSQTYIVFGLVLFLLLTAGAAAFMFSQNQSLKSQIGLPTFRLPWTQVTCTHEGRMFQVGESVPSIDGCNSCSCDESGQVACTEMACETSNHFEIKQVKIDIKTIPNDWEIYKDSIYNYSFKYPSELILEPAISPNGGVTRLSGVISDRSYIFEIFGRAFFNPQGSSSTEVSMIEYNVNGVAITERSYSKSGQGGESNKGAYAVYTHEKGNVGVEWYAGNDIIHDKELVFQILSTFEFIDNPSNQSNSMKFSGKLMSYARPEPDIEYDFQLKLDTPYFDELNAQGPSNITSIVVVPVNETIRQTLASNIGNSVSIEGVIEWGLAETRHLKATKIVEMDN